MDGGIMTSRLLVDKIESKSGNQIDMSTHQLKMPAGHVVQTQTAEQYTQKFTNSTSYVTTGLSVSITPKFSTSRLFFYNSSNTFLYSGTGSSYNTTYFHLYKSVAGATAATVNTNTWLYQINAGESNSNRNSSFTYTEIAGTTSPITYELYLKTSNDDTVWNEGAYSVAVFTVQEVAQ